MIDESAETLLSRQITDWNIWLHAWLETVPHRDRQDVWNDLSRDGNKLTDRITEGLEYQGRMLRGVFLVLLKDAKISLIGVQNQLSTMRRLSAGDDSSFQRAKTLHEEASASLDQLIQSLEASS